MLAVHAIRRDGFDGEIQLAVKGLPPGFAVAGGVIPRGDTDARFTLSAPADLKPGSLLSPVVEGQAIIKGKPVAHAAQPAEQLMVAFSYIYRIPTQEEVLHVVPPPPFVLSAVLPPVALLTARQGDDVKFIVKIDRKQKVPGQIGLALDRPIGLPSDRPANRGLNMKYVAIPPDKDQAEVVLTITRQAPAGDVVYAIIAGTNRNGGTTTVKVAPAVGIKVLPGPTSAPATRPSTTRPSTRPAGSTTKPAKPTTRPTTPTTRPTKPTTKPAKPTTRSAAPTSRPATRPAATTQPAAAQP